MFNIGHTLKIISLLYMTPKRVRKCEKKKLG